MTAAAEDERPSPDEVRRRIEVALESARIENAGDIARLAAVAIQPLIDSLKSHRAAANAGATFTQTVQGYVRSHAPSDLRSSLLTALQDLEPWNGEWVRLAQESAQLPLCAGSMTRDRAICAVSEAAGVASTVVSGCGRSS